MVLRVLVFSVSRVFGGLDGRCICVLKVLGVLGVLLGDLQLCLGKVRRRCITTTCVGGNIYLPEG